MSQETMPNASALRKTPTMTRSRVMSAPRMAISPMEMGIPSSAPPTTPPTVQMPISRSMCFASVASISRVLAWRFASGGSAALSAAAPVTEMLSPSIPALPSASSARRADCISRNSASRLYAGRRSLALAPWTAGRCFSDSIPDGHAVTAARSEPV